jgi:hypothetical protein
MRKLVSLKKFLVEFYLRFIGLNIFLSISFALFIARTAPGAYLAKAIETSPILKYPVDVLLIASVPFLATYMVCAKFKTAAQKHKIAIWVAGISLLLGLLLSLRYIGDPLITDFLVAVAWAIGTSAFSGVVVYVGLRLFSSMKD